ncbi:MAG TPA: hypothetical protein ENI60_06295 [Candidatus Fraserbacteria bacterium]|nr:hypothetical protein [Candidatus Fraserbacteria bacterium]
MTMIPNITASQFGPPKTSGPVRFAVGPPDGLTSNAWRFWTTKQGDVYIACRDNFKEAKVSLHASGRWRMGFTTEAIYKNPQLVPADVNRAWEIWDEPPASLPNTIVAFRLIFPTSELAVRPEQRPVKIWKNVLYIEAAPSGKVMVVTLFVTVNAPTLRHESEPSICLASLDIGNARQAQFVAHSEPEGDYPDLVESNVAAARKQA